MIISDAQKLFFLRHHHHISYKRAAKLASKKDCTNTATCMSYFQSMVIYCKHIWPKQSLFMSHPLSTSPSHLHVAMGVCPWSIREATNMCHKKKDGHHPNRQLGHLCRGAWGSDPHQSFPYILGHHFLGHSFSCLVFWWWGRPLWDPREQNATNKNNFSSSPLCLGAKTNQSP